MPAHTGWQTTLRPAPRPEQPEPSDERLHILAVEAKVVDAALALRRARECARAPQHRAAVLRVERAVQALAAALLREARR